MAANSATFAAGRRARAQCPVCSDVVAYLSLRKRWDGSWVCRSCLDPKHPAEVRKTFKDAISLHHGKPDRSKNDVNVGFGIFAMTHDSLGVFTVVIT